MLGFFVLPGGGGEFWGLRRLSVQVSSLTLYFFALLLAVASSGCGAIPKYGRLIQT